MDQFAQTNDLQQAIDNVANGNGAADAGSAQLGVPPMPPTSGDAPIDMMFKAAPAPEGGPAELPKVEPLVPAEPSAEQILSESLTTEATAPVDNNMQGVDNAANMKAEGTTVADAPTVENTSAGELADVKKNILKDLLPLLDKTGKTAEEKWDIYKEALSSMHDVKTVEGAYRAASGIADEAKKADALFELMKTIG